MAADSSPSAWPPVVRALRHRNYRLYFFGQMLSLTGTWMQNIAQAWLIYRLTDSAALLGLISFTSQAPVFLLSSLGGVAADRFNRHRLVITAQVAAMVLASILALLALTETIQVWQVFLLAGLLGTINAIDIPARQSFIADIVDRPDLPNAIALYSSVFNGARIVGPAVAGVLVAAVGEGWCFFINAVSFIPVLLSLYCMRVAAQPRRLTQTSPLADVVEAFRFVRHHQPIRTVLIMLAALCLLGTPYVALMPIFADRVLDGGAHGLGLLMGAAGCGALIGGIALAARVSTRGLARWIAGATAGFGATLALFALSHHFWLSAALLVGVGLFMLVSMAASNTLIQSLVPDPLRGRVMAIYSMTIMGAGPVGALLAGAVAEAIGAQLTVGIGAIACVLVSFWFRGRLPQLRSEARRLGQARDEAATVDNPAPASITKGP
jgi:MFS family permease